MSTDVQIREERRIKVLYSLDILDTEPEWQFEALCALAAHIADTPMASITLVDRDRQWFKSRIGIPQSETKREISFCGKAIEQYDPLVVLNAETDPRFADSPLVLHPPHIRFYCGVPITVDKQNVGAICTIDRRRKEYFTDTAISALSLLASLAADILETRRELQRNEAKIISLEGEIANLTKKLCG